MERHMASLRAFPNPRADLMKMIVVRINSFLVRLALAGTWKSNYQSEQGVIEFPSCNKSLSQAIESPDGSILLYNALNYQTKFWILAGSGDHESV
jgi:hypothetical protein